MKDTPDRERFAESTDKIEAYGELYERYADDPRYARYAQDSVLHLTERLGEASARSCGKIRIVRGGLVSRDGKKREPLTLKSLILSLPMNNLQGDARRREMAVLGLLRKHLRDPEKRFTPFYEQLRRQGFQRVAVWTSDSDIAKRHFFAIADEPVGEARAASERESVSPELRTFEEKLLTYHASLIGYAKRLCNGHAVDPEDIVQETMRLALGSRDQLRADMNMRAWLFTIMRNVFLKVKKAASNPYMVLGSDAEAAVQNAPTPARGEDIVMLGQTMEHMKRLPEGQRRALELVAIKGLAPAQAAEKLGVDEATIRTRLHRARQTLRELRDGDSGETG